MTNSWLIMTTLHLADSKPSSFVAAQSLLVVWPAKELVLASLGFQGSQSHKGTDATPPWSRARKRRGGAWHRALSCLSIRVYGRNTGGTDVTVTTRIIAEDGTAKGLRKHTERKGDKCGSADHTCASDWGLRRSHYSHVDTFWAAMGLKAVSTALCPVVVEQVRRRHSHTPMVAVVSDLFVGCPVLCSCGDGGPGRKVHTVAYRTWKLSLYGSLWIHTASGKWDFTNNPSVKTLIDPAPRKWKLCIVLQNWLQINTVRSLLWSLSLFS